MGGEGPQRSAVAAEREWDRIAPGDEQHLDPMWIARLCSRIQSWERGLNARVVCRHKFSPLSCDTPTLS